MIETQRSLFNDFQEDNGALFSDDERYRYRLWRIWDDRHLVVWVLLNPSTADATTDDPTLRRCLAFAREWRAGGVIIVNLFAARATDPSALRRMADPVGLENDDHIRWACSTPMLAEVVCGWGVHGALLNRDRAVRSALCSYRSTPWCLGHTKGGHPQHPLYVAAATPLERYR